MPGAYPNCPICGSPVPDGVSICPDCGENLAAIQRLRLQPQIAYNSALERAHAGDWDGAVAALQASLAADPQFLDAWVVLGKLYAQRDQADNARSAWQQALTLSADHTAAREGIAQLDVMARAKQDQALAEANAQRAHSVQSARAARRRSVWQGAAAFGLGLLLMALVCGLSLPGFISSAVSPISTAASQTVAAVALSANGTLASMGQANNQTATALAATISAPAATASAPAATVTAIPLATATPPLPTATATPTPLPDLVKSAKAALAADSRLQALPLELIQDGLTIRVRGSVPSLFVLYVLETSLRAVEGVRSLDTRELTLTNVYIVRASDNLWDIAARVYGTASYWHTIAEANAINPPYTLSVGQRLILPPP